MGDSDSDDDLLTLDVLAIVRKGYQESHKIVMEQRAAKAAAAAARVAAAEAEQQAKRAALKDVSNLQGKGEGASKASVSHQRTSSEAEEGSDVDLEDMDGMELELDEDTTREEDVLIDDPTFAWYKPKKLTFGQPHPGRTVETSVMARVTPPDITYKLHSGMKPLIESGRLSSLQLESIVYACQQHEYTRVNGEQVGGFFLGDGAGVGKGRQIAGLIYENWLRGRKRHMWFSVSNDLYHAAIRDLSDIGAGHIPTKLLSSVRYDDDALDSFPEGCLFITYSTTVGRSKDLKTRTDQIIDWAGGQDFNGCCVFDEGHKAKKLVPEESEKKGRGKSKSSKTALSVSELQQRLPNARVVYVSATGASSLENLAYMERLGIWGYENMSLFEDLHDFLTRDSLRKSTGALELIAMNLKSSGKYLARTLSFSDTSFEIRQTETSEEFCLTYNTCVDVWNDVLTVMDCAERDFWTGNLRFSDPNVDIGKHLSLFRNQYWGSHLRFFKHLCVASKLPYVKKLAEDAIEDGNCVVIGLLSTGEAATMRWIKKQQRGGSRIVDDDDDDDDDLDDDDDDEGFVGIESTLREIIKKFLPESGSGVTKDGKPFDYSDRRKDLLEQVAALDLPQFPLDDLIDGLGGPDHVAEITGRQVRLERAGNHYKEVKRAQALGCAMKDVNRLEVASFMRGDKLVAIISDAGSVGISLHADRRAKNRRRRVHITIELPYSSTQLVQQLGRSHRSNQASGPQYISVISDLPGEIRFAATAAKRLAQLGAITQGDRMACLGSQDLKDFDLDTKFGSRALKIFACFVIGEEEIDEQYLPANVAAEEGGRKRFTKMIRDNLALVDLAKPLSRDNRRNRYRGNRLAVDSDDEQQDNGGKKGLAGLSSVQVSKFFNRLLALKVDLQHEVFSLFESIHHQVVNEAKASGKHDSGVQDLYAEAYTASHRSELLRVEGVPIQLNEIAWDRGVSWESALEKRKVWVEASAKVTAGQQQQEEKGAVKGEPEEDYDDGTGTGFYRNKIHPQIVVLALEEAGSAFNGSNKRGGRRRRYKLVAPNTGERGHMGSYFLKPRVIAGSELHRDYDKDTNEAAIKKDWEKHYLRSANECIHVVKGEKPGWVYDANGRRQQRFGSRDCWLNPHHWLHNPRKPFCPLGRRYGKSYILSGSIIKCWPAVENCLAESDSHVQVMGELKEEWQAAERQYQEVRQQQQPGGGGDVKMEVGDQHHAEDRKFAIGDAMVKTDPTVATGGSSSTAVAAPVLSEQAERMKRIKQNLVVKANPRIVPTPVKDDADGSPTPAPRVATMYGKAKKAKKQRKRTPYRHVPAPGAAAARAALVAQLAAAVGIPFGGL